MLRTKFDIFTKTSGLLTVNREPTGLQNPYCGSKAFLRDKETERPTQTDRKKKK